MVKYKSAIRYKSFVGDPLLGLDEIFYFGIVGYVIEWEWLEIPFFSRGFYRFDHLVVLFCSSGGLFTDLERLLVRLDPDPESGRLGGAPGRGDLQTIQDSLMRFLDHLEFFA